jgi:pilus assembly protein Flp/PilA
MTKFDAPRERACRELARFAADEGGATSIEYAMIAVFVSVAIVGAVSSLGANLKANFYDKLVSLFP